MSIMITPVGDTRFLTISGDIEQTLAIPSCSAGEDYVISMSDGTLLAGTCGDDKCHTIRVAIKGAAIVRHVDGGGVTVDLPVDWLTIAPASASVVPMRQPACLPLFPQCVAA